MADNAQTVDPGLSGHSVRGAAESAVSETETWETHARDAADTVLNALNNTGETIEHAAEAASNAAFQNAADVGVNVATPAAQAAVETTFSWGGYFQAIGALCLLLAALWAAVWLIRRYGKFNFIPRPGSLPRDALVMEAQLPLGPKRGLMVVRFLNKRLLLGVTEHRISLLTEEKADNERRQKNFQGYMEESTGSSSGHSGASS